MSRQKRTIKKKWKLLFYILLTINIIVFLTITLLIFWPVSETEEPTVVDHSEEEGSEFIVRTTKENLNRSEERRVGKECRYRWATSAVENRGMDREWDEWV